MSPLSKRVALLFALVAIFPVALTALVWLGFSRWGVEGPDEPVVLARTYLEQLDDQREAAVLSLCRDDLVVDRLLADRAAAVAPALDYDRLLRGTMRNAGLQALWVLDSQSGEVLAAGHTARPIGRDGSKLLRQAREAQDRAFLIEVGPEDHQRMLGRACAIARGGTGVVVVGAHRFTALRALDPAHLHIVDEPSRGEVPIGSLAGSDGEERATAVWRASVDRRAPPLLLWVTSVTLLALGVALLLGSHLSRWLEASVDELTVAATRVGAGNLTTTIREADAGAFQATATAFNRMTRDLQKAQADLRRTERIAAWQEIARRLAHELKNPLSPIRLSIETLRKAHARSHGEFDALFEESTRTMLQEVERLRHIVDEFSRFARLPAPTLRTVDLREVVPQAVSMYGKGDVTVAAELPEHPVTANVDPEQITQVLHNLLQNACDAARAANPGGGGEVRVGLEQGPDEVRIRVEDNGPGIREEEVERIFEPYFTKKEGGTGLGLAITNRIIEEHGGRLQVASRPGKTVFTVTLTERTPTESELG